MQILQITPSLYNGGGEIFAFQLSETLAQHGHHVRLLSVTEPDPRSPLIRRLNSAPFEFISLGKKSGTGVDLRIPFGIRASAQTWKPDIIHTHLRALAYSLLLTPESAIKFHTVHSIASKECSRNTRILYKALFSTGWQPVAISHTVGKSIQELYNLASVPQVDNGVQQPMFNAADAHDLRIELGIKNSKRLIVHIGRLIETKNQLALLNAFERIAESNHDVHLALVGNDPVIGEPYRRVLENRCAAMRQHITRRVHMLGVRGDIGNILKIADIFVLCSRYEGLPLTLLEAMSFGLKCVCTKVGGIPDAIDANSGWLVEPDNEDELVQALQEALTEKSNHRGKAAHAVFEARFSMRRCAEAYETLYEQTLEIKK